DDGAEPRLAVRGAEDRPAALVAEECRKRDLHHLRAFPFHDAEVDGVAIAEARARPGGGEDVEDGVDALLLDPERRDLGARGRVETAQLRLEWRCAAPAFDD